jgi:hypothetical protein
MQPLADVDVATEIDSKIPPSQVNIVETQRRMLSLSLD